MNIRSNTTTDDQTTRRSRRGSTLIVVLALLAILSMLGLALVVFSGSEKTSAENFSAGVEREMRSQPRPSGDVLSQFAISRLALGGLSTEPNSALYGGRHSVVPGLVGRDLYPHNGQGINVISNPNVPGSVLTDQDYDGNPDPLSQLNLQISDSPIYEDINGNGQLDQGEDLNGNGLLDFGILPRTETDVGFTAPDINSVFLSFNGVVHNDNGQNLPNQFVEARTPSFSRPQYRRTLVTQTPSSWETHRSTA
ncbi:MAG: pilus assembly PilX N-terminal domain-containing protein, partial [Planctomycetota bacterium]|nr:pilus assembly PilX N-terminal domain-containing protein [Planctomycetota bacterium]